MFISALKRQYWAYFLLVLPHSIASVFERGFAEPLGYLALRITIQVFVLFGLSFLLFCIGYPLIKLAKWCIGNFFGTTL